MVHYPPKNLDIKRSRNRGPYCPYCGLETRVFRSDEIYVNAMRGVGPPSLMYMELCVCVECRAWAPAKEPEYRDGKERAETEGIIADTPTRKLRSRAHTLQKGVLRAIRAIRSRSTGSAPSPGQVFRSLRAAYFKSERTRIPSINLLDRAECEQYIEWLRAFRVELDAETKAMNPGTGGRACGRGDTESNPRPETAVRNTGKRISSGGVARRRVD